ncbi:MAG: Crp/Fnr family transcriptional regulator [Bacteroidales bacterium]|nr:Crp/Fnr family transcriptional regulator [Bacteroidales bacterium]
MIEELQRFEMFSSCTEAMLEELLALPYRRKTYKAGDKVVRVGDTCEWLMLLAEGGIESRMGAQSGKEVVIERMQAPKILAPAFLFAKNNTIPVEVSMTTDGVVWYIHREAFFNFMTAHPEVLRGFLEALSDRSHFLSNKVRSFAVKSLRDRVLDYIRQHGAITNVAEAAEMLGVARPSLSRLIADLQDEGLVERTENGVVRKK